MNACRFWRLMMLTVRITESAPYVIPGINYGGFMHEHNAWEDVPIGTISMWAPL